METSQHHVIDAAGKPVGRVATQAATLLRGKHKPSFEPHKENMDTVEIKNAKLAVFTGKKMKQKMYIRHSGYLGSLKSVSAEEMMDTKPEFILQTAIEHMLPKNRLQAKMMKRLTIHP